MVPTNHHPYINSYLLPYNCIKFVQIYAKLTKITMSTRFTKQSMFITTHNMSFYNDQYYIKMLHGSGNLICILSHSGDYFRPDSRLCVGGIYLSFKYSPKGPL